jgi:hypothetical protein
MRQNTEENRLPARAVFGFLAETIRDVARRIEVVEVNAAGAILGTPSQDPARVMALQELDLIRQMAEDAARVAEIARKEDGGTRAGLAAALRLAALRDILANAEAPGDAHAPADRNDAGGRVEFFGSEGPAAGR